MKTPIWMLRGYFFLVSVLSALAALGLMAAASDDASGIGVPVALALAACELVMTVWSFRIGRRLPAVIENPRTAYRWGVARLAMMAGYALIDGGVHPLAAIVTLVVLSEIRARHRA